MNQDAKEDRKSFAWGFLLMAMLIFYPLSLGPVVWMAENGYLDNSDIRVFVSMVYFPLEWSHENNESVEKLLDWYISFWRA